MNNNISILFIEPGPAPPPETPEMNCLSLLGPGIFADVVQTCWGDGRGSCPAKFNLPNVRYHFTYSSTLRQPLRVFWDLAFFVFRGLSIFRSGRRFQLIVAYGTTRTAAAALILKWLTRSRLILDIPGDPRTAYLCDSDHPTSGDKLKHSLAHLWTRFLLRHVDRLKLLFPEQMDIYPQAARIPKSLFAAFVPISSVNASSEEGNYVLFLGFPWHLKGVDVLIRAFNLISDDFRNQTLKIVGHCPNRIPFEALRGDNTRIEFHKGVSREKALELIAGCTCLVLPSRTEAMGRVLLEAMAARKPVIASRVGGIPYYVKDRETGLLFESGNVEQLASCLRLVLGDESLRRQLAARAFDQVHERLNEHEYARQFTEMIRQTISE
jgi:glycosyltransferase involved in cell wall biosynthesis